MLFQLPRLKSPVLIAAVMLLCGCARTTSEGIPNLSEYGNQVQKDNHFNLDLRGNESHDRPAGTLVIWTPEYQGMNPFIQKMIDSTIANLVSRFESDYSTIKVIWEKYSDSHIYKRYSQEISSGLGPDVLLSHNFMISQLGKRGDIQNVKADFSGLRYTRKKLLKSLKVDGKLYAIPFIVNVQLLCFDKRKISTAPESLDKLVALSKSGISVAIGGNFLDKMWGLSGLKITSLNSETTSQAAFKDGLTRWIVSLKTMDLEPNLALFKNTAVMTEYFSKGKISIMNCTSIDLPLLREKIGSENLGVAPLPTINGQPATPRLTGASFVFNPFMSENQKNLAHRFVSFAVSTDQQQQIAINWNSILPVNTNSDFSNQLFPVYRDSEYSLANSFMLTSHEFEILSKKFNTIQTLFEDATSGLMDPDVASQDIVNQLSVKQ